LIISILLAGISLFSCNTTDKNDSQDDDHDGEISAKDKEIMDEVISLMEDDTYDTDAFIAEFFGDFSIGRFDSGNNQDANLSKMYKIGDVLAVENQKAGETTYQIVVDSKLCSVYRTNDGAKLHLESSTDYPYEYPLSIFTAFGVDMSLVYSTEESPKDEPKLTYDSLSVSKDKKTVTFSKDYLKDVAEYLMSSLEPSDKQMKDFLADAKLSGSFDVERQLATTVIEGKMDEIGDVKIEAGFEFKDQKPISLLSAFTLTADVDGVPVTTTQENIVRNITYENDKIISLTVENRNTTSSKYTESGVDIDFSSNEVGIYDFATKNSVPDYVNIRVDAQNKVSYSGQTQESSSSLSFAVSDGILVYELSADGLQQAYLAAEDVAFKAPSDVTIPQDIYTVLPK